MNGLINKIIGVILVLVLMVLMLSNVMVAQQLEARRSIIAEVTNFVDEVTDTGNLNERDVTDLKMAVNAYGPSCNVDIYRYTRVVEPIPGQNGKTQTSYVISDNIYNWNQGDLVKVHVEEVGFTGLSFFLYATLHLSLKPVDFGLAGRIR